MIALRDTCVELHEHSPCRILRIRETLCPALPDDIPPLGFSGALFIHLISSHCL